MQAKCSISDSADGVQFERTGRVPRRLWLGFIAGCAPVAFVLANAAEARNYLPAILTLGGVVLAIGIALLRPVWMYVRVIGPELRIRRGFYRRNIPVEAVTRIQLFKLAYPGLRSRPGLIGVVVDPNGRASGRLVLIGWADQDLAGLSRAVGAPYSSEPSAAPIIDPASLNSAWQNVLGATAPWYGYVVMVLAYGAILCFAALVTWATLANSPSITAPR
jgi:hypothetical protein